jgi:photosystem II stability/assembly factor-like uncharacterized protein
MTLYSGGYTNFNISHDAGDTWASHAVSVSNSVIYDISICDAQPSTIYAAGATDVSGYKMAVFKSLDGGISWETFPFQTEAIYGHCEAVAVHPSDPNVVFAGGYHISGSTFYPMIVKSTDGGASWSEVLNGVTGSTIHDILLCPDTQEDVLCAGSDGAFRTNNAGANWQKTVNQEVYSLAIDPNNPSIIYAGVFGGIYRSQTRGQDWVFSNTNIESDKLFTIVAHPVDPQLLLAGSQTGIHQSDSMGLVWNRSNTGFQAAIISHIRIAPSDPNVIYAGVTNDALYRSADAGQTWTRLNPFYGCAFLSALAVDPVDPNRILAFSSG